MDIQNNPLLLKYVRLNDLAKSPFKGSPKAAGYDLHASSPATIPPRDRATVDTGLIISVPSGTYGRIAPRSGLATHNIDVGAGVVDADYRGQLKILLVNHSNEPFQVKVGDRVAQLICEKIVYPELLEVETLDVTDRGSAGFGSSGIQ